MINACTIDSFTLNSGCTAAKSRVLNRLVLQKRSAGISAGSGGTNLGQGPAFGMGLGSRPTPPRYAAPRYEPEEPVQQVHVEQPYITVSVEILGMAGAATAEVKQRIDFVQVIGLEI